MSGLMDKAKDAMGKGSSGGDSNQGGSGIEKGADNAVNQQIDSATDRAGLGDKYDSTIDKAADSEVNKEIPGGK